MRIRYNAQWLQFALNYETTDSSVAVRSLKRHNLHALVTKKRKVIYFVLAKEHNWLVVKDEFD